MIVSCGPHAYNKDPNRDASFDNPLSIPIPNPRQGLENRISNINVVPFTRNHWVLLGNIRESMHSRSSQGVLHVLLAASAAGPVTRTSRRSRRCQRQSPVPGLIETIRILLSEEYGVLVIVEGGGGEGSIASV